MNCSGDQLLQGLVTNPAFFFVLATTFSMHRSLANEHPWAEHLTSLPKHGVGTLLSVSTFNHERAPHYVYSDLIPSKQIIAL